MSVITGIELELLLQRHNVNSDNYKISEFKNDDVIYATYVFTYNNPLDPFVAKENFARNILIETISKPITIIVFLLNDGFFTINGYHRLEIDSIQLERKLKIKHLLRNDI